SNPEVQVPGPKAIPSSTAPLIPGERRVRVHQGPLAHPRSATRAAPVYLMPLRGYRAENVNI
ncbi:hypothetical protein CDV58_08408, partial [Aspergillus fumigatus]